MTPIVLVPCIREGGRLVTADGLGVVVPVGLGGDPLFAMWRNFKRAADQRKARDVVQGFASRHDARRPRRTQPADWRGMSELEELSCKAAMALPKNWGGSFGVLWQHHSEHSTGKFAPHGVPKEEHLDADKWLHESTEACTEIMVRVLWPAKWVLEPIGLDVHVLKDWNPQFKATGVDLFPMEVFRRAVLEAVCRMEKP